MRSSSASRAVSTSTGILSPAARIRRSTSKPSMPGRPTSRITRPKLLLPGALHRVLARGHDVHRVAFALEDARDPARQRRVVFDDQNPHPVNHTAPQKMARARRA